jgi:CDP-diacylglycerol---glycerol-3-phosphate 3-phosphatidyltransferase
MNQKVQMYDADMWARESVYTWANAVTLARTVIGVALFAIASSVPGATLRLIGLAVYWIGDMLDGWLARRLNQETRLGAQMDIIADRLLMAFFYISYAIWRPDAVVPIALFLIQFMLVDQYLSLQFLRYPLLSPNYFYRVDPLIWRLNWSPLAKLFNTGMTTVVLLIAPSLVIFPVVGLLLIKIYSAARLYRLSRGAHLPGGAARLAGEGERLSGRLNCDEHDRSGR